MADPHADRVVFAEQVLGLEVFDHQAPALRSTAPTVVVAGGRRSGKTLSSQVAALHCCFTRRGAQWLVISTKEDKVREYLTECHDLVRGDLARSSLLDSQAMRLTFSTGSEIVGLTATSGSIRGFGSRVFGATVDECGFQPDRVWRDLRYVMLDHHAEGAQVWMIGSPFEPNTKHFFRSSWDAGMAGDPDFDSFQWRTEMNPRLPTGWLERERARLRSSEAAMELDGEWTVPTGALFSHELLLRCTADYEALDPGDSRWDLGAARFAVGMDWGVSYDMSSYVALGRLPVLALNPDVEPRSVFGVAALKVWPPGTLLSEVWSEAAAATHGIACVSSESNGVGSGPTQELRRLTHQHRVRPGIPPHPRGYVFNDVTTTARLKTDAYGRVLWLLEQGRLVLPRDPNLLRQLAGLRFERRERGSMTIEASDAAVHDDVTDALALATGPYPSHGRIKSFLSQAAARDVDEAPMTDVDVGELTSTGAGLVLPARPWWQSVDGLEVTASSGAATYLDGGDAVMSRLNDVVYRALSVQNGVAA